MKGFQSRKIACALDHLSFQSTESYIVDTELFDLVPRYEKALLEPLI
jgi:hypothetical protein